MWIVISEIAGLSMNKDFLERFDIINLNERPLKWKRLPKLNCAREFQDAIVGLLCNSWKIDWIIQILAFRLFSSTVLLLVLESVEGNKELWTIGGAYATEELRDKYNSKNSIWQTDIIEIFDFKTQKWRFGPKAPLAVAGRCKYWLN